MSQATKQGPDGRDYTDKDIQLGPVLKFAIGIALFTAAVFATVAYVQHKLERAAREADASAAPMSTERVLPTQAVLQVKEVADLAEHRAWETSQIEGYALVDRTAGLYRIPVTSALDKVAARGLPVRGKGTP